jgi:hypothetical protein
MQSVDAFDEAEDSSRKGFGSLYGQHVARADYHIGFGVGDEPTRSLRRSLSVIHRAALTKDQQRWGRDHAKVVVGHALWVWLLRAKRPEPGHRQVEQWLGRQRPVVE